MDYPPGAIDGWRIEHPAGGVLVIASNPAGQAGLHTCTQNPECKQLASAAAVGRLVRLTRLTRLLRSFPELMIIVKGLAFAARSVCAPWPLAFIVAYFDLALLLNSLLSIWEPAGLAG